jgi:hypothetical protein
MIKSRNRKNYLQDTCTTKKAKALGARVSAASCQLPPPLLSSQAACAGICTAPASAAGAATAEITIGHWSWCAPPQHLLPPGGFRFVQAAGSNLQVEPGRRRKKEASRFVSNGLQCWLHIRTSLETRLKVETQDVRIPA